MSGTRNPVLDQVVRAAGAALLVSDRDEAGEALLQVLQASGALVLTGGGRTMVDRRALRAALTAVVGSARELMLEELPDGDPAIASALEAELRRSFERIEARVDELLPERGH
jgi:hypothetical protein